MANPIKKRMGDLDQDRFMPRELSWLSFNARVLQEAADPTVPIVQRLRYLGIFSSNLDEFFRVRVAEVRRLISLAAADNRAQYSNLLEEIQLRVIALQKQFDHTYQQLLPELRRSGIYLVNETQLDERQSTFVQKYFVEHVLPELEPILLLNQKQVLVMFKE